jgi:hypothetical protein
MVRRKRQVVMERERVRRKEREKKTSGINFK